MTEAFEQDPLRRDIDRYGRLLEQRFGDRLVSVVLFGSRARGEAGPESDVDLVLVIRGLPPIDRFRDIFRGAGLR